MIEDKPTDDLERRKTTQLRWTVGIVAAFMISGAALAMVSKLGEEVLQQTHHPMLERPARADVDEQRPLYGQTARVELGGRIFNIPLMFIDSPRPSEDGVIRDSILLKIIWPEMRSLHELKDRAEYDRMWNERRIGNILLHSAAGKPSLDAQVANTRPASPKEDKLPSFDGLESVFWYRGTIEHPTPYSEMHFERDVTGHIITRIDCHRGLSVKFPGCSQTFVDRGVQYNISYNEAAFLPQWREQRQRVIEFLSRFEMEKPTAVGD